MGHRKSRSRSLPAYTEFAKCAGASYVSGQALLRIQTVYSRLRPSSPHPRLYTIFVSGNRFRRHPIAATLCRRHIMGSNCSCPEGQQPIQYLWKCSCDAPTCWNCQRAVRTPVTWPTQHPLALCALAILCVLLATVWVAKARGMRRRRYKGLRETEKLRTTEARTERSAHGSA